MLRKITMIILMAIMGLNLSAQYDVGNEREKEVKERISNLLKSGNITQEEAEKMFYAEMQKYLSEQNVPIEFYGKVIDQEGEAVVDADVICSIGYYTVDPENYKDFKYCKVKTDRNGIFEVKAKSGISIRVIAIKKDGYENSYNATNKGAKYTKKGYIFEHKGEIPKQPDPSNPEIFQIRKKGEPTILLSSSSLLKGTRLSKTGPISYALCFVVDSNFLSGEVTQRPLDKAKEIGMRIDAVVTLKEVSKDHVVITVNPVGEQKGVLVSKERLYVAPEIGYKKELDVEIRKGESYYLYLKSGTPPIYTLLEIENVSILEDGVYFSWSSCSNPYGDRNLESDGKIVDYDRFRKEAEKALVRKKQYPVKPEIKLSWQTQNK